MKNLQGQKAPSFSLEGNDGKKHSPEMMKKYGAFGKKMMYGKEVQGTIRSTVVIGPKGDVIKHWPTVKKAEAHPDEVMAFLKSL
jgi:peroxiredoxin